LLKVNQKLAKSSLDSQPSVRRQGVGGKKAEIDITTRQLPKSSNKERKSSKKPNFSPQNMLVEFTEFAYNRMI
jgi:hypothetical protein